MRKALMVILCLTLSFLLLIGCSSTGSNTGSGSGSSNAGSGSGSSSSSASSTPAEKVTITFLINEAFTRTEEAAVILAAKQFEEETGIEVVIEPIPSSNLKEKYTSAALAGGGPDVVMLDTGGWIVDAAAIGIIADLSELIAPIASQFQPGPMQASQFGGKFYAVPWYLNNAGFYYNNDILSEAGISSVPTTWAEFEEACSKIQSIGKKSLSIFAKPAYLLYPFFFQNNCSVIDTSKDIPVSVLDTPEALEAFTFFLDIGMRYNGFPESSKEALTWDQCYAPFIQGECAFMICGDWGMAPVSEGNPDLDFGIAPLPIGKTGGTVMGGFSLCINNNSKNFDAAWRFIEFMTAVEQNDVLLSYGRIGARVDIDATALIDDYPHLEPFVKQAAVTFPRPIVKDLADCDDYIAVAFQEVYLDGADPQEALLRAHEGINKVLIEKYS